MSAGERVGLPRLMDSRAVSLSTPVPWGIFAWTVWKVTLVRIMAMVHIIAYASIPAGGQIPGSRNVLGSNALKTSAPLQWIQGMCALTILTAATGAPVLQVGNRACRRTLPAASHPRNATIVRYATGTLTPATNAKITRMEATHAYVLPGGIEGLMVLPVSM